MADLATKEPTEIIAGDLIKWKIAESSDYPLASSWVLTYAFVMAGNQFEIVCTDNGDNYHLATITAAISAKLKAGTYKWQSYITLSDERYFVDSGSLVIQPNFAALDGGHDDRSHWAIVLDNVEAVIQGRATRDQSSYTVAGRQLSRTPVADLIVLYDKAKSNVASEERAERIALGLGNSGTIKLRFGR